MMQSVLIGRNVFIGKKRTSIKLEQEFWEALERLSHHHDQSLSDLCLHIRQSYPNQPFTSAVRVFILRQLLR
jgi:predicted DNA-binding ribbon-helix-helix protein